MRARVLLLWTLRKKRIKRIPSLVLLLKSNGATLYATTDLATIWSVKNCFEPDQIIYLADKRQSLHFPRYSVWRKNPGLQKQDTELDFIGFGTMNGKRRKTV